MGIEDYQICFLDTEVIQLPLVVNKMDAWLLHQLRDPYDVLGQIQMGDHNITPLIGPNRWLNHLNPIEGVAKRHPFPINDNPGLVSTIYHPSQHRVKHPLCASVVVRRITVNMGKDVHRSSSSSLKNSNASRCFTSSMRPKCSDIWESPATS